MSRRITRSLSLEPNNNDICPICMGSMDFYNLNQHNRECGEKAAFLASSTSTTRTDVLWCSAYLP